MLLIIHIPVKMVILTSGPAVGAVPFTFWYRRSLIPLHLYCKAAAAHPKAGQVSALGPIRYQIKVGFFLETPL